MAMGNLPKEMERPKVIKASALDIPAFYLDISLKNERDGEEASAQFDQLCDLQPTWLAEDWSNCHLWRWWI